MIPPRWSSHTRGPEALCARFVGIWPVRAGRVVAWRQEVGPFGSLEELSDVGLRPHAIAAFAKQNLLPTMGSVSVLGKLGVSSFFLSGKGMG